VWLSEAAQDGSSRRSLASAPAPRMKTAITTAENATAPRQRYRPRGSLEIAPYTTPIIISSLYTCELKPVKLDDGLPAHLAEVPVGALN